MQIRDRIISIFLIKLSKCCLWLVLGTILAGISLWGFSQSSSVKFDKISTENTITVKGLSQNSIYCMMQDYKGFIWIGTWDGLNRYDGYEFIIYNTSSGLSHPTVNALMEDDEMNIWIGTDDGLNILDRNTGQIIQFHHDPAKHNSLSNDFINHIFQDKNGMIWISTSYGLNRYDKDQQIFTFYNFFEKNADSTITNFVTRATEDENGLLWISTRCGIHCFDHSSQDFTAYKMQADVKADDYLRSNYVQDFKIAESGDIYTATLNGVFVIRCETGVIRHLDQRGPQKPGISSKLVNVLFIDSHGMVWIGTIEGLDMFDPVKDTIISYKAGSKISNLSNGDIKYILEDNTGTIWIGTYKGLNKIDRSPSRFRHFISEPDNPNSLSDNIVYALLEDSKRNVWVGTYDGVNILDGNRETYTFITHDPDNPASLSSNKIRTINVDHAGNFWVTTESSGINRIDPEMKAIRRYYNDPGDSLTIAENNIISSFVDSKGSLWIGTSNKGISIMDPATGRCVQLNTGRSSPVKLSHNKIWCVYEDDESNYWIGTGYGLNKISPDFKTIKVYSHDHLNPHSISSNTAIFVTKDKDGLFWIGTMGGGLNRFDPITGQFRSYSEPEGLMSDVVYSAIEDDEENLWLTTNRGIVKFNKQNETFITYDTKDGAQGNEFNAGAYFKNTQGVIFFGGMNGFNMFHPHEITINKMPPRLVFTGLWILNDRVGKELEDGEIIRLDYNENYFALEFSSLDYTNPFKNLYRFKLENYDNDWVLANASKRLAEYRKVDPGTYHFRVTGSNNDGVWNQDGISVTIVISPPWWKTWIFRILVALFLIAIIWSVILLRINAIRKKHSVEKKMLLIEKQVFELEQKALRLQMNPHFIFNSLNAIQNFVLANDTDKAVNYLAKFSYLMRMILANSTASLITLKDELKALTYYIELEKLRFDDKFDYIINKEEGIDEEFVEIPPMLFQPYVENAIIHGLINSPKHGMLKISVKRLNLGTMLCSIEDNGIGREKAIELREKSGINRHPRGMLITQERIEIFNRQNRKNFSVRITDLKDENGLPAGTKVEFTIQYKET